MRLSRTDPAPVMSVAAVLLAASAAPACAPGAGDSTDNGASERPGRGGATAPGPGQTPGGSPQPGGAACSGVKAPSGALRHLTRDEYNRTIRDLLGDASNPANDFPPDLEREGFSVGAGVSPLLMQSYLEAAERLAERARPRAKELAPCASSAGDVACARTFIQRFGLRAYRRPLVADEAERLEGVYQAGASAGGHEWGVAAVIQAALTSPSFFYRAELEAAGSRAGAPVNVAGYEAASRLSYFLWKSMPDDALFEAARRGELATRAQMAAQARRMLRDAKAKDSVQLLFAQWWELGGVTRLEKDRKLFPFFTSDAAAALLASVHAAIDHLVWEGEGSKVEALWTTPVAFVNARLAPFFGVTATGAPLSKITLPATERPGLLSHPALLSLLAKPNQSDPVHRGKFVRERVLCEALPEPPPNVDTTIPEPKPGESTRARFARHSSDPACGGCHKLIDSIGFGFEAYDAVGRLRREDNGAAIDARGEIHGASDAAGGFADLAGLSEKLAASVQVRRCVAEQVLRHALVEIVAGDLRCDLDALARAPSVLEMLVAATQTTSFATRTVSE